MLGDVLRLHHKERAGTDFTELRGGESESWHTAVFDTAIVFLSKTDNDDQVYLRCFSDLYPQLTDCNPVHELTNASYHPSPNRPLQPHDEEPHRPNFAPRRPPQLRYTLCSAVYKHVFERSICSVILTLELRRSHPTSRRTETQEMLLQ